ncbi:MAG TPA: hypothetical protein VH302_09680 [Bryobacteraceae bacterium]|jgi:hypothetical protein|nr:hypothetical protein [Bryobacteraceae bacterium]
MLPRLRALLLFGFVLSTPVALAKDKWTELNIGPFYIDTQDDVAAARNDLTQLEQVRWVLGGLLESKDLPSLWPIRVLLLKNAKTNPNGFVLQQGRWLLVTSSERPLPLGQVALILLQANTQRLPPEVEAGLPALFSTIEAHGAHVTWGTAPAHPDLNWARMQLFATKWEYSLSFHIFLAALKSGTDMRAAERNAFGQDPAVLEREVAANLAKGNWPPTTFSGRPLDPKRDFGEHEIDDASAQVYIANANLESNPDAAEDAYKAAIAAGGRAAVLGYDGMAGLAELRHQNPKEWYDHAIKAGSHDAIDFVGAAQGLNETQGLPLLKQAEALNPMWAEPVFEQANLAADDHERLDLLKKATRLDPRDTEYWVALAQLQTTLGDAAIAQSSWVRAEDSAATPAERDRLHQERVQSEQDRLDAAEAAAKREREAVHQDDQRAQDAEAARIRAAEERANKGKNDAPPGEVLPWSAVVPEKHLTGRITAVDCLGSNARLEVQDRAGKQISLLLKDAASLGLPCGPQKPARTASISYSAAPNDRLQTAGQVTSLKIQ